MNPVNVVFEDLNGAKFARLTMNGAGKFNPDLLKSFDEALDKALDDPDTKAVILTGEGKNFSQGLDLEAMATMGASGANQFLNDCMEITVGRLLLFPMPVVCAMNGHAFGLGAMIALAADYRVMREDRGFFCLPESTIQINLIPSMNALVTNKLYGQNLRDVLLTGMHMGGVEAAERGIVDASCSEENLIDTAKSIVTPMLGKHRTITEKLKLGINEKILPKHFAQPVD